jgi:N-acetyl-alpha-D-muramate 1-phosphate uridylyltransferase
MKAMILAAGLGTRLQPFTLHHPKALAPVNGKSLLQRNIEYLQLHGIRDVIINVHHFADQILEAIATNKGWGSNIVVSDESNEVLETGGGLLKAKHFLETDAHFVLLNVDMLTDMNLTEMITKHTTNNALATLAISDRKSSRAFLFNADLQMCGWQNTVTNEQKLSRPQENLTPYAFSGLHVIDSRIFTQITQTGKFGMVEVYLDLCKTNNIIGYNHSGCKLLDVGKPECVVLAESMFE